AGDVKFCGSVAEAVVAGHRGKRITVGDRLAPRAQVRLDAERIPAAVQRQPETGADIVEDQRGAVCIRECTSARRESGVTQVVVASVPFLENSAQSAWVTRPVSFSASSTMRAVGPLRQSPSAACLRTASSTSGRLWPSTIGPQLHIKSRYFRPSTS